MSPGELHRRFPALAWLALGAVATIILFLFIRFPPETKTGVRIFFSILVWGLVTLGLWSMGSFVDLLRELPAMFRKAPPRSTQAVHHIGPLPILSSAKKGTVRRIVATLSKHGVFGNNPPDPETLFAGIAERDERIDMEVVLSALGEADYYHPGFDPAPHLTNLALHETQVEQFADYLEAQIADLARLGGDALTVTAIRIDQTDAPDNPRAFRNRIAMTVNGEPVMLDYVGADKYLSTAIHHALATRFRAASNGRRFAWLWTDQGPWITVLDEGGAETLNADLKLGPRAAYRWEWMDEGEPLAAA